ncbi:MAG: transposase [Acidobacteriota bacterium]|nr:transposase [Acidobacteriota bacterium]
MQMWLHWWSVVSPLRAACSRQRTFLWLATVLAGFCTRDDLLGVSSFVRTLGLAARCYQRLLKFFHSEALDLERLTQLWTGQALRLLPVHRFEGRPVLLGDGIKIGKSGRKMPAVKRLHQESDGNTKPEFIMGHSVQVISLLVAAGSSFFAVPLAGRIHEGVKFSNRDQRTLPEKFGVLLDSLKLGESFILVVDAYYACRFLALQALAGGSHLLSRVRRNTVAHLPPSPLTGPKKRGRPRVFGEKLKLWTSFDASPEQWQSAMSPVYGERGVTIRFLCRDLLWRPLHRVVRFVLVDHPSRGRLIFIVTDLSMPGIEVIRLYGLRFKIELSFKQALRVIGVYAYHFWMSQMHPLPRRGGTQYLHRKSDRYRNAVRRKIRAYHAHIQIGLIAQGLLQYLAVSCPRQVWACFGSWLRTIRPGLPPSEFVTRAALRNALPDFLAQRLTVPSFKKFLRDNIELGNYEALRLAG